MVKGEIILVLIGQKYGNIKNKCQMHVESQKSPKHKEHTTFLQCYYCTLVQFAPHRSV